MNGTDCKRCARKSQLFICSTCIENLRRQLRDLPWWLDRLIETALGDVRMSDGGRRSRKSATLHGDDELAAHLQPYPNEAETDLKKARKQRERAALASALAAGRVNARASDEYQRIHNTLTFWVMDLCETRGIETPRLSTASDMARWLATNANAIASQDNADRACEDLCHITKTIERIVNRPVAPRFIGPCPGSAPDHVITKRREQNDTETRCNQELTAQAKATEVTCPSCKQAYNIEELLTQLLDESGEKIFTVRELVDWILPRMEIPVPQKTLENWINRGWVPVHGHNDRGHQMVKLREVREARADRPRHAKRAG